MTSSEVADSVPELVRWMVIWIVIFWLLLTCGRDVSHVFRFGGCVLSRNLASHERVDGSYVQRNAKRKRNLQYALPPLFSDGRNGRGDERGTAAA